MGAGVVRPCTREMNYSGIPNSWASGLTVYALSKKVGMPRQYLGQLENGTKTAPGFELVYRIADALGVTVGEFR